MEQLNYKKIYLNIVPFHQYILPRYILAICYIHHCLYGTSDAYKFISSTSKFIFTVVMKVLVKPSVFLSKFQLFSIGCLLYLKHKYCIDTTAQVFYKGLVAALIQQPSSLSSRSFSLTEIYVQQPWILTGKLLYARSVECCQSGFVIVMFIIL